MAEVNRRWPRKESESLRFAETVLPSWLNEGEFNAGIDEWAALMYTGYRYLYVGYIRQLRDRGQKAKLSCRFAICRWSRNLWRVVPDSTR